MTMVFPTKVPLIVYEILFIVALSSVGLLALNGSAFKLLATLLLLYFSLCAIKWYQEIVISTAGKSVFISGCDTGFGHGTAQRLHQEGFRVFAGCLFPDGEGAKTLLEKCPDNLYIVPLDVTKEDSVRQAETYVRDHLDETCMFSIKIVNINRSVGVVNNAGIFTLGDIELVSTETVKHFYDVNTFGMLRVTKAFLPLIRNSKGRITNVSSVMARHCTPLFSTYVSSKVALECFTDCLRMEMRKFGVVVSMIQPGAFAFTTQAMGRDNVRRMKQVAEKDWENLSEEVKQVYPINYVRALYEFDDSMRKMGISDKIGGIYEAILDTLVSSNPRPRTVVQGGPFYIDIFVVVSMVLERLPTSISDWLACKQVLTPKYEDD